MSDSAGLKRSQALSQFVQDYHVNRWKEIGRVMPQAKPTPVKQNFNPSEFVDVSVLDYQKLGNLLALVGIRPLSGEPIGSPMQRLHISSRIAELNRLQLKDIPNISNLEDIALLDGAQQERLRRVSAGEPPNRQSMRDVQVRQKAMRILERTQAAARALEKDKKKRERRQREMLGEDISAGEGATLLTKGKEGTASVRRTSLKGSKPKDDTPRKETTRAKRAAAAEIPEQK
jgi:hypothetical protein